MDRQQRLFIIFTTLAGFFAGTVIIAPFINEESPSHVLIYASQAVLLFAALGGFIPTRIRTNKPLIQTKVIKGKQVLWLSILFLLSYPIVSGLTWLSETILAGTAFGQQIIQNDIDQVGQLPAAFPKDSLLGVLLGLASIALLPAFVEEFLDVFEVPPRLPIKYRMNKPTRM